MSERREDLLRQRTSLLTLLEAADDKTAPALSRELRAVNVELESIPVEGKKATVDELKAKRAERQAEAQDRARPNRA